MKLTALYEYLDVASGPMSFYGDPKAKGKVHTTKDVSFLKGGKKDRNRFLKKMERKNP